MNDSFWTSTSEYGLVHKSANRGQPSKTLLVFVHGLFGDSRHTWGTMPAWVLENAAIDMDVISFSYPSKLWQRCSIALAAEDLRTWLQTEFAGYRNILFITHSTGGLVVKQTLKDDFSGEESSAFAENFDFTSTQSIWIRTRRVINIAVPHRGGSRFVTLVTRVVYRILYLFMAPFLGLIRFVTQGNKDAGRNRILSELRWHNPKLLKLEEEFTKQQEIAADKDFPYPMVHDLYAKSDLSVPIAEDRKQRDIYFRGTHKSVKVPNRASDPIITIVSDMVRPYGLQEELTVVEYTLSRIALVDRATGTQSLIEHSEDDSEQGNDLPTATVDSGIVGTQSDICRSVLQAAKGISEYPPRIVVTGSAGVGKSVVLRRLAWRLGCDYLEDPGNDKFLPLFIPLQQVTISDPSVNSYSWSLMWQWWIRWTSELTSGQHGDFQWLEHRFHHHATVIIIDGVDDFLVNHPTIGLPTLVNVLRDGVTRFAANSKLSIVVGIRSGFHGLERLASDSKSIHEVLRLSTEQAKNRFPTCRNWLPNITDKGLLDFVLTPLILSNFEPESNSTLEISQLTQYSIMEQTLRTILRRSGLIGIKSDEGLSAEIDHLLPALILVAWLFFYRHRGEIAVTQLREEAQAVYQQWQNFLEDQGLTNQAHDIIVGFKLIVHHESCDAILKRTVFVASGPDMHRFSHRSWQEFLVAKYFALCLKWGNVEDFGKTAFNSHIYRLASESFRDATLTASQIKNVLDAWKQSNNTYISGNVIAFLAWGHTAIEAAAIELLLDDLANYEALSRIVGIAGLGYRVLVNAEGDASVDDLRRILYPKLKKFAVAETAPVDDRIASSLAWCYQKAFAYQFSLDAPETPWPDIGFDDEEASKALPMISTMKDGKVVLDDRSRSLQLAFLVPIIDAYDDPTLAIRAMHYLYYLVVARKYKVHVFELSQELPQILAEGSRFEKIIQSFTAVPELSELYRRCQIAFNE